jgi:hypothetical protein
MRANEPNVGLRLTAEAIAAGIKAREADDPSPMTGVADPAMFAEDGGPSIAQRMIGCGVIFRPADNKRVAGRGAMGGWDQVRARLEGDADGKPMLLLFSTSRDLIRTLPALQHDDARPEDVDSDMEDHAPDSCRYACMSRLFVRGKPVVRDTGRARSSVLRRRVSWPDGGLPRCRLTDCEGLLSDMAKLRVSVQRGDWVVGQVGGQMAAEHCAIGWLLVATDWDRDEAVWLASLRLRRCLKARNDMPIQSTIAITIGGRKRVRLFDDAVKLAGAGAEWAVSPLVTAVSADWLP